ncbi:uncharacterized protein si:ch211-14k19.8 isoform X1 [Oryzias melastigma]|uniref:Mucin-19-like n=1 Tax=Oryzias melastigma TaxID=30732 RepID=A0A3B3CLS0_ORYME|nr:uncharacterized protein si:ch211-14k19.8 isoform X1 [Oryzias melastigma]
MQLHTYLLLFIITTEKTLASLNQRCGGNVSLDREPVGRVTLTSPGLFTDTSPPDSVSDSALSLCTWVMEIPPGKRILLKVETGSHLSLCCAWNEGERRLQNGEAVLLSGCDGDKAILRGSGFSSNIVSLVYYVQGGEQSVSDVHSTHQSDQETAGLTQTGPIFTSTPTAAQEGVKDTEDPLYEGRFRPLSESSTSSPYGRLRGRPVAGNADRETLYLPEEKANNGAETSGAARDTKTRPYFQDTVKPNASTERVNSWTEMSQSRETFFSSTAPLTADTEASKHTQTDETASHSSLRATSSENQMQEGKPTIIARGGAAGGTPGGKQSFSWRSQRSTDQLNFHPTSTSDLLRSSAAPPHRDSSSAIADTEPTSSFSSPTAHIPERGADVGAAEAASGRPHANRSDSLASSASAVTDPTTSELKSTRVLTPFGATSSPESAESLEFRSTQSGDRDTRTESPQKMIDFPHVITEMISTLPDGMKDGQTSAFTDSLSSTRAAQTQNLTLAEPTGEQHKPPATYMVLHDSSPTGWLLSSATTDSSTPPYTLQPHSEPSVDDQRAVISSVSDSYIHTGLMDQSPSPSSSHNHQLVPTSSNISPTYEQTQRVAASAYTTTTPPSKSDYGGVNIEEEFRSSSPTASHPSQQSRFTLTASAGTSTPTQNSTSSPMFFVVPNQPAAIREDSVELLLQIIVEDAKSAFAAGLEEDTAAWMEPYLQRAPGFSKLLGVWSSGHAVQSLLAFNTRGALQWLSMTGSTSLLERTGLAQAVREGKTFRSSRVTNITLGGLQGDVCSWLLQCPEGYKCGPQPGTTNYSCSSVCHFDHCHHHGICTHHPDQLPVCRCLVGDDFWYMGQRCDTKMTRARLAGACLAVLLIAVIVIGTLAYVAVRRYRDILIQAKVDQTRSSYRRFNHFDELSGRFWLRSWAGSADSLDNLGFTRSDDLLHLRARDHPCCFHDDTLSLPSTCPSHGAHISTIYPHSSQYGWRGSGVSVGDGVLDSGKASDLSVCSWPVEPIHWTPFPLLQQLASHRTPAVRVSRPRSYCEGMELVDMGKSWTA